MKMFSKIKYRHKVAVVIFLFVLLPFLVLSMFIVKKMWDDKVNTILEKNESELKISVEAINTLFLSGLQKLSFINSNGAIVSYFAREDFSDLGYNMSVYNDIKTTINTLVIDNSQIGIVIYPVSKDAYNGEFVKKVERLEERLNKIETGLIEQIQLLDWDNQLWLYQSDVNDRSSLNNLGYIYCYKTMQSYNKTLAICELRINISEILKNIKGEFPIGTNIIYKPIDKENTNIIQNSSNINDIKSWSVVSDTTELDAVSYYPIEIKLNYSPGVFILFIPHSHIMSTLQEFLLISVFVMVFSIIILFLIVELASYLITRRLSRLIDTVNINFENTDLTSNSSRHLTEDDLGRMEEKVYDMLNKIRQYYKSILEHENEKQTFELELLQSRINPHFLYNTLSTMKWNCKNEKMADIIDSMVQYYRLALNKGDTIIKISQEIKLVEEYLKIQKYTYESDFIYIFDIDDDVMESFTIKHILQPVVENAVLHGINGLDSGGMVKISGKLKDGIITLKVWDNGVGISEDTIQQILCSEYKSKIGGYGINNVQRRINLFYGPNFTLNITSLPKRGTTVEIVIPAKFQ